MGGMHTSQPAPVSSSSAGASSTGFVFSRSSIMALSSLFLSSTRCPLLPKASQ